MKKLSIVITVPALVIIALLAIVFFLRVKDQSAASLKSNPDGYAAGSSLKPGQGFTAPAAGETGGTSASDLSKDLRTTSEGGDTGDLDQLQEAAAGL